MGQGEGVSEEGGIDLREKQTKIKLGGENGAVHRKIRG